MVELVKQKSVYVGGTFDTDLGKGFRRTGADLIKKDLIYHLFTRRGERVMLPDFGTDLQDIVFEPNDPVTQDRISGEIHVHFQPARRRTSCRIASIETESRANSDGRSARTLRAASRPMERTPNSSVSGRIKGALLVWLTPIRPFWITRNSCALVPG